MNNSSLKHHTFNISELDISSKEIEDLARMDESMPSYSDFLQNEIVTSLASSEIEGGYIVLPAYLAASEIIINNTTFAVGSALSKCFENITHISLFACTAGEVVSERVKELNANGEIMEAYLLDVLGSVMVEKAMDKLQAIITKEQEELGLNTTNRYSPGYSNWHMSEQIKLFSFLPNNFCNITLSDSCLMIPAKSVSGFIGIGPTVRYKKHACQLCNSHNCLYRNSKNHC